MLLASCILSWTTVLLVSLISLIFSPLILTSMNVSSYPNLPQSYISVKTFPNKPIQVWGYFFLNIYFAMITDSCAIIRNDAERSYISFTQFFLTFYIAKVSQQDINLDTLHQPYLDFTSFIFIHCVCVHLVLCNLSNV